jgi:arylsulfatase A-like enzyme
VKVRKRFIYILSGTCLLAVVIAIVLSLRPRPRPNVLLITLDTTRWDHLSCYGYAVKTTPAIDGMAREAVRYERAISPSSWTLPAHASIFTGMLPTHHRAHFSFDENIDPEKIEGPMFYSLHPDLPTLAEDMKTLGYRTGGIVAAPLLTAKFGFGRGFDYYEDRLPIGKGFERDADEVSTLAISWLNEHRAADGDEPFFLFLNYFDPHSPYQPPEPWGDPDLTPEQYDLYGGLYEDVLRGERDLTDDERNLLLAQYDRELMFMDNEIGRLFEEMKRFDLYDSTMIIITSDHGESFGEHRLLEHGRALYEELIRVPLIVKYPSYEKRSGVVARPVSVLGIGSTILQYAGSPALRSVAPPALEERGHQLIAEIYRDISWIVGFGDRFDRDRKAIYDGDYKWIWDSREEHELYDVAKDPAEENNLWGKLPERERRLKAGLAPLIEESEKLSTLSTPELDKDMKDRLRALGYIK